MFKPRNPGRQVRFLFISSSVAREEYMLLLLQEANVPLVASKRNKIIIEVYEDLRGKYCFL